MFAPLQLFHRNPCDGTDANGYCDHCIVNAPLPPLPNTAEILSSVSSSDESSHLYAIPNDAATPPSNVQHDWACFPESDFDDDSIPDLNPHQLNSSQSRRRIVAGSSENKYTYVNQLKNGIIVGSPWSKKLCFFLCLQQALFLSVALVFFVWFYVSTQRELDKLRADLVHLSQSNVSASEYSAEKSNFCLSCDLFPLIGERPEQCEWTDKVCAQNFDQLLLLIKTFVEAEVNASIPTPRPILEKNVSRYGYVSTEKYVRPAVHLLGQRYGDDIEWSVESGYHGKTQRGEVHVVQDNRRTLLVSNVPAFYFIYSQVCFSVQLDQAATVYIKHFMNTKCEFKTKRVLREMKTIYLLPGELHDHCSFVSGVVQLTSECGVFVEAEKREYVTHERNVLYFGMFQL